MDAFATITQKRMTGGFRIDDIDGKNLHIDPGPGALIRSYQFGRDPRKLSGVFVSHSHTDHYTDAEVLIEAMTKGMTRRKGIVVGSLSVIEGFKQWGPCISDYHKSKPEVTTLGANKIKKFGDMKVKGTKTIHGDPTAVGFQFQLKDITISYTADTEYFEKLHKYHRSADILVASVIRPRDERIPGHMCSDDFSKLIAEVSPKLAIMTHLGMKMIINNPEREAERIQEETGVKVLAARDGMHINLDQVMGQQQRLDDY
ncbi:MBL fold metallo-hydrolase [Methanobacterium alcaliphilum]|uniref:MBL fold metallo-hydrolase n=1 Tax=Methanobacterium alcaliphilum TaxID=392018 RepID=UPI0031844846